MRRPRSPRVSAGPSEHILILRTMHALRPDAAPRALRRSLVAVLALAAAACGGGGGGSTDPQPPAVTGLNPATVTQYDEDFTLTVNGSGFTQSAVVRWNGSERPTQ